MTTQAELLQTEQSEAPPGLQWLQSTLGELRSQVEELRKQVVGSRMKISALEADAEIRDRREADLREELRVANEQLDSSSASMRASVKEDVLSDLEALDSRDKAVATCLVILAAKVVGAGQDSLARLGLPDDIVRTVRGLVFGITGDSVTPVTFMDGGNGMRYSAPPVTAQVPQPPVHNRVTFLNPGMSAEEIELREYRAEMITRTDNPNGILPRRATDRMLDRLCLSLLRGTDYVRGGEVSASHK